MCIFKCYKANGDTEIEYAFSVTDIPCFAKYVNIEFLRRLD